MLNYNTEITWGKYSDMELTFMNLISYDKPYAWFIAKTYSGRVANSILTKFKLDKKYSLRECRLKEYIDHQIKNAYTPINVPYLYRTHPEYLMDLIDGGYIQVPTEFRNKLLFKLHRSTDILK